MAKNSKELWAKLRQSIKRAASINRELKAKGYAKRGRFTVRPASKPKTSKTNTSSVMQWKNAPVGVYFVSQPVKRGRFKVENIKGFVPFPK